jgi:hypothetical protein
MPHATHKARRIDTSGVPHAPVRRRRSRFEQQALLTASVGFTMVVIIGLYAATFRARDVMRPSDIEYPRWSILDTKFIEGAMPMKDELVNVKETLKRLAGTGKTQVDAAVILKAKIKARAAAASGTPETPETP